MATDFVQKPGEHQLVRIQREERLLPASVIRSEVNSGIREIRTGQGCPVLLEEHLNIVDEVVRDFLPHAILKFQHVDSLINDNAGWVLVNSASAAIAEDLLSLLREGFGNLPVTLPDTQKSRVVVMSQWVLNGGLPDSLSLGGDADLQDSQQDHGVARARGMYLEADEIRGHIESGKQVVRLALSGQDQLDVVQKRGLRIRRIRISDEFKGANEELREDALAKRDADCSLIGETVETPQKHIVKQFRGVTND